MPGSSARNFVILLAAFGLASSAHPQNFELTVTASSRLAETAARIREIDPSSLAAALSRGGLDLPSKVNVSLVEEADPSFLVTHPWIVAQASGTETIVIFPGRVRSYPFSSLESVVLHEVVHLSLNLRARGRPLPRWFHEGVAVSVESGWGIGSQARLLLAAARDPGLDDVARLFSSEAEPETATAYLLSAALVEDIRRRHGLAVPGAIAARVATGESFETAFYAQTGESVDDAAAQAWRVYRGLRWLPVATSATALWGGILVLACLAFVVRIRRRRQKRWDEPDDPDPLPHEGPGN